jgi:hypothetical protein
MLKSANQALELTATRCAFTFKMIKTVSVEATLILNSHFLYNASATASNPQFQQATQQCRALASRLHAFSAAVPLYGTLSRIHLVPCRVYVYDAAAQLIGLSNTTATTPADLVRERYLRISKLLGIRVE